MPKTTMKKLCPYLSNSGPVVDALDDEIDYVNNLARMTADNGVSGQLVTLTDLVNKANAAWAGNAEDEAALDVVRKIAGAAVRTLILYGCPRRPSQLRVVHAQD